MHGRWKWGDARLAGPEIARVVGYSIEQIQPSIRQPSAHYTP